MKRNSSIDAAILLENVVLPNQCCPMLLYHALTLHHVCVWTGSCRDFGQAFERTFSIPGEVAILECPLQIYYLFDPAETPHNVTWYDERTGSEITELEHSVMLRNTQVWFFNVTLQQHGKYTCVVRYERTLSFWVYSYSVFINKDLSEAMHHGMHQATSLRHDVFLLKVRIRNVTNIMFSILFLNNLGYCHSIVPTDDSIA